MARRGLIGLVALNLVAALLAAGLAALGLWQVHRRAWKLDLVARVETRLTAEPVAAPGPDTWPTITAASDAYRRVTLGGEYEPDRTALVQAVTEYGAGFWVMTPLRVPEGWTVLVNRGFVPADRRDASDWRAKKGAVAVTGLLRITEPGGAFLRSNDPQADRWYSRDIAAIAQAKGLGTVAPYFVDAAAAPGATGLPVAGLTVVAFPNNHLVYAITWFVLAAMILGAVAYLDFDTWRRRWAKGREAP